MKHLFNNLSQEEKNRILEMHQSNNEVLNEQLRGLGSQIGARVKQAAQTVGTVGQRVGQAIGGKQDMGKNAGLEGKVTYVKNTAKTLYNNLLTTSSYLKKSKADVNKMGDYADEAKGFNSQIDGLTTFLDDMASQFNAKMAELKLDYQPGSGKTEEKPAPAPAEPATKTPNPEAGTGIA
jgi:ABC-type transporter Mla subunit MlaD